MPDTAQGAKYANIKQILPVWEVQAYWRESDNFHIILFLLFKSGNVVSVTSIMNSSDLNKAAKIRGGGKQSKI